VLETRFGKKCLIGCENDNDKFCVKPANVGERTCGTVHRGEQEASKELKPGIYPMHSNTVAFASPCLAGRDIFKKTIEEITGKATVHRRLGTALCSLG
jgi:hypothetical protein